MDVVERIRDTLEPSLKAMGYTLVQLKLADGARRKTLTLMAERQDDQPMGIGDCSDISRMAGALLEVEDPISGAYDLEVCSPGIDRPLTRFADFSRYKGYEAKLETMVPMEGRKRFRGIIGNAKSEGERIELALPEGDTVEIAFSNLRSARLVMTDALVAEHLRKQKKKS